MLCCVKNTGEPLLLDISFQVTSPLRGHFYLRDTSLEPEGVPWIEVSLYSIKQEQGSKSVVRRDPNFPVDCKQFLEIAARTSFLRVRERGKRTKRCSLIRNVLARAKILTDCLHSGQPSSPTWGRNAWRTNKNFCVGEPLRGRLAVKQSTLPHRAMTVFKYGHQRDRARCSSVL